MDLAAVQRLRRTLSLHFAIIACLTALLVAAGSQSMFLPVFIFFVSAAAFIFVDSLQWFELGRIGSYIGMLTATAYSIGSYLYYAFSVPSESGQLLAIAGLLVYPEAVLFLQRKNLRVFEQLAVFLLLEMIVAALVNDNILFGVLLAPIMLLWVSSLFLFSRYATLVQLDPSIEKASPKMVEVLFRRFMKSVIGEARKAHVVSAKLTLAEVQASRSLRRTLQSVPIGIAAIAFAGFFFYLLPRTKPASLVPSIGYESKVGLPKSLSIGTVGRLLQDPTPVMRVTLTDAATGKFYELNQNQPPYLRARVMDTYGSANRSPWVSYGEWIFGGIHDYRRLRGREAIGDMTGFGRDLVKLEFDVKRQFASTMISVPPAFAISPSEGIRLNYDRLNMTLEELDAVKLPRGKSLVYEIGSAGFSAGNQLRVFPALIGTSTISEGRNLFNLTRDFPRFQRANTHREELLAKADIDRSNPFAVASFLEGYFLSGEFTYTLNLRPPADADIDPIEDFLLNQRKGHCQYFASAMLLLMRQSGIPGRIVVGYRPTKFNGMGKYFPVRQSDAHAWVEGLFSRDNLVGTELERELTDSDLVWVQFDPTPSSDGEDRAIVEQEGQTMDYVEKLWKDYVVEGQKLTGENGLYEPVAENSKDAYEQMVEGLANFRQNMKEGRLFTTSGGIGFAWPLTIFIIGMGVFVVLVWRILVLLPRLAPRLARKLGIARDGSSIKQAFFARCMAMLEKHGLTRKDHETPQEFTRRANDELTVSGRVPTSRVSESLDLLTSIYYRLRFSKADRLTDSESSAIQDALGQIESLAVKSPRG